jgi:hypothetical protein
MLFARKIRKNEIIRPILIAGILEKDYDGERVGKEFHRQLEEAMSGIDGETVPDFKEFDRFTFNGVEGIWQYCSTPSPQYASGRYYHMEKVALMPVYTVLESETAQTISVRFNARRICVWLNGKLVLNNSDLHSRKAPRVYVFEHAVKPNYETAELKLNPGKNRLLVVQGAVGRGTGMSFSMELLEHETEVTASVPLNMAPYIREEIAHSQMETYMRDDGYVLGETPVVHIGRVPMVNCSAFVQLFKADGTCLYDKTAEQPEINLTSDLPSGEYEAVVTWKMKDGTPLTSTALSFNIAEVTEPLPGYDNFMRRRELSLERLAAKGNPLALYRLERYGEIPLETIRALCDRIHRRVDCADFDLLPLLWLVWEDRNARLMSDEIHSLIRDAALGFRYWVDEPGTSSMFYCSENHRIGFHVCEYLAGLLYPSEMFSNCGQNGMYHSMKGRMHLVEWLSQRCRAGFDEPHSDTYLPITMDALLVLREVLPMEEYPLRNMTDILLDFMTYIFAVSSFDGVMATPRGRSYNKPLRTRLASRAGSVFWALFGNAPANARFMNENLAFSYYVPPRGLCELADNFTPAEFTFKQGIMHFDKHNADFTLRRTADYIIGGVRDHNVGMCDMHFVSAMIALRGDVSVFFSAPHTSGEGGGLRPDYWAGQAFLPRVLMSGRTLAVIWHNVNNPNIWMTHCHFNKRKFDEIIQNDGWTFGRKGEGYVAIHSSKPHYFNKEGLYAQRELVCDGNETVWLAECGRREEDGSFEGFMRRILGAALWTDELGCHFDSPGSGLIEFGLTDGFTVDRVDVPVSQDMACGPYLKSRFGSGRFEYTCPGFTDTKWSFPLSN